MEFWGVEVKAGKPLKVVPEEENLIHLSQVSIGEAKGKGSESVPLYVKVGDQKLLVATLSHDKFPQVSLDLVFEKEFELSHNSKSGSLFLLGYKTPIGDEEDQDVFSDFESDEEDLPLATENGNGAAVAVAAAKPAKPVKENKAVEAKPKRAVVAPAVPVVVPSEEDESDDSEFDEEDDSENEDDDSDDADEMDEDDSSEEEEEETPKKEVPQGKKRNNDSAAKTPVSSKKAKVASPVKSEGKKGHTATPHPAKKGGKPQTPKSGGQFSCSPCKKTFGSETGLASHSKAKHGK